jgi:hypothetical protein
MTGSFVSYSHRNLTTIDELEDAVYLARDFFTQAHFLGQILYTAGYMSDSSCRSSFQ